MSEGGQTAAKQRAHNKAKVMSLKGSLAKAKQAELFNNT